MFQITLYGSDTEQTLNSSSEVLESSLTSTVSFTSECYQIHPTFELEGENIIGIGNYQVGAKNTRTGFELVLKEIALADYGTAFADLIAVYKKRYKFLKVSTSASYTYPVTIQTANYVTGVTLESPQIDIQGGYKSITIVAKKQVLNG